MPMPLATDHHYPEPRSRRKRTPDAVDLHVGANVRRARMLIGMSQEKLAEALDLSFQQVAKYEKGINRISAARLSQISLALGQPIPWFYEGASAAEKQTSLAAPIDPRQQLGRSRQGLELWRAFLAILAIDDPKKRRALVRRARELAGNGDSDGEP